MTCRYSHDVGDYLTPDGDPCRRDEYGDPTRHCTAQSSCSQHIGAGELTCARCVGRTRSHLRRIADLSALMLPAAIAGGVDSEAANLAGPATDPVRWSERRIAMGRHLDTWEALGRITERQHEHALAAMPDDDERHPYGVLTRWQAMLTEDYGHPQPERYTITGAAAYLGRHLHVMAQDDEQDFPLLARELRKCARHLEAVLRNASTPERGAPCPECTSEETGVGPRLVREYGHWCEREDCERFHYDDDSADVWTCPRDRRHEWSHEAYTNWIEERRGGRMGA